MLEILKEEKMTVRQIVISFFMPVILLAVSPEFPFLPISIAVFF